MRDLILIGVTALVSGFGGAFLAISLDEDAAAIAVDGGQSIDVETLAERIRLLEEKTATTARRTHPGRERVAPEARSPTDAIPGASMRAMPADRREQPEDRMSRRRQQVESRLRDAGWIEQELVALNETRQRASLEYEQQLYESMLQRLQRDPDMLERWPDRRRSLRADLGDERYAQLLEAEGRPTTVTLNNVLVDSAGAAAGLRPGDNIRRYGSERVFGRQDLTVAILSGEAGEPVTLEFERDGSVFHVTVPRGPLGISDPLHR